MLTEDRLMSLLLLLVAVWFLYVRYQESKAFAESQASQSSAQNGRTGSRSSSYAPSQEYLAELNMEKKRDYDSHLQQHGALHASARPLGGEAATVRLYPESFDDDNLMEGGFANSNLRGAAHYGASSFLSEETGRDTGMYMPSEVRLKLVEHGGLDRGPTYGSSPHIPSPSEYAIAQIQKHYNDLDGITEATQQQQQQHGELDPTTKKITDRYRPIVYPTSTRLEGKGNEYQKLPGNPHPGNKPLSSSFTAVYGTLDDDTSIMSKAYSTTTYKPKYYPAQPVRTKTTGTVVEPKEEYLAVPTLDEQQIPKDHLYIPKRAKKYKLPNANTNANTNANANANVNYHRQHPPPPKKHSGQAEQSAPAAPEDNVNGSTGED